MRTFLIGLAIAFGLLVVVLFMGAMWIGLQMESGALPDTVIVAGEDLSEPALEAINKAITLRPGETIAFFYSTGVWDWEEDGNLITNQRVVSYMQEEDGELFVEEADYANIAEIETEFSDNWIEDTLVWITPKQEEDFVIALSIEEDLDHPAVEYIERKLEEAKQ